MLLPLKSFRRASQYDAAGRLVMVADDAGVPLEVYTYGAGNQRLGRQVERQQAGIRTALWTHYVWSSGQVIAEYTERLTAAGDGQWVEEDPQWGKSYVYLGSRVLATLTPGEAGEVVHYHHPDRLGTRLVTNAADTTVTEQVTLPFGVALPAESTGDTNPRFTSYDRSAVTGLDYAQNRFYDPDLGRFTQVDPLGMGAANQGSSQSLNMYAYVQNDPVNSIDPTGTMEPQEPEPQAQVVGWCTLSAEGWSCVDEEEWLITGIAPPDETELNKWSIINDRRNQLDRAGGGGRGGGGGGGGGGQQSDGIDVQRLAEFIPDEPICQSQLDYKLGQIKHEWAREEDAFRLTFNDPARSRFLVKAGLRTAFHAGAYMAGYLITFSNWMERNPMKKAFGPVAVAGSVYNQNTLYDEVGQMASTPRDKAALQIYNQAALERMRQIGHELPACP